MISLVVAVDMDWAIGRKNQLLCHLPNDLKNFKNITEGGTVVMGRKTWESLPIKPLPNRFNIILSKSQQNMEVDFENAIRYFSVDDVISLYATVPENYFIIGGSQIYSEFMDYAERIYMTKIHHRFTNADTFFPPASMWDWEVTEVSANYKDAKHAYDYDFIVMERRIFNDEK